MQRVLKLISDVSTWLVSINGIIIIARCRRSRQQWSQLLRKIYRKTEKLRTWNQGGRIRSGRHDDIHKRILLRWDRTGRVFLGGEHFSAHATGIHRPVSGNGKDQVGRKFFSPRLFRANTLLVTVSSLYTLEFPFRRLSSRREMKKEKEKKWWSCVCGQGDGRAMERGKDGKEGREGRGWLLDVSGITIRDEMKLKDSCCVGRWGGRRGTGGEKRGKDGIAGVQLIKRELYSDLVRISYARALYYVSTRRSLSFCAPPAVKFDGRRGKNKCLRLFVPLLPPPLLKSEVSFQEIAAYNNDVSFQLGSNWAKIIRGGRWY